MISRELRDQCVFAFKVGMNVGYSAGPNDSLLSNGRYRLVVMNESFDAGVKVGLTIREKGRELA